MHSQPPPHLSSQIYLSSQKKTPHSLSSLFPRPSLPQPLATTVCFGSSCVCFSSYKWNPVLCGLVRFAPVTEQNVFRVHPCCNMAWFFITVHDPNAPLCERPQTVYPGPFCFVVFSFQSLNSTVLNYLQLLPSLPFCINRIFF